MAEIKMDFFHLLIYSEDENYSQLAIKSSFVLLNRHLRNEYNSATISQPQAECQYPACKLFHSIVSLSPVVLKRYMGTLGE